MTTYKWDCESAVISGLWKFDSTVTLEELQEFAIGLKVQSSPCSGYEELYIRGVGKNGALGIGFRYRLSGLLNPDTLAVVKTPQKGKEEFFHKYTDQLKKRFGNQFVGWDLSNPTWTLVRA